MSSIPRSYIDDIRRIAQSVLNQLESLKVRSLHGLEEVNGVEWTGGGVTDHGALTGLADDDHTQYLLINGSRAMTNDIISGSGTGMDFLYTAYDTLSIKKSGDLLMFYNESDAQGLMWLDEDTGDLGLFGGLDVTGNITTLGNDSTYNIGDSTYAFNDLYIDRILGSNRDDDSALDLDFRGDGGHRIRYNGTTDNDLEYLTYAEHNFKTGSSPGSSALRITSTETALPLGGKLTLDNQGGDTYIKDTGFGDMELHVATGKSVKIVVG